MPPSNRSSYYVPCFFANIFQYIFMNLNFASSFSYASVNVYLNYDFRLAFFSGDGAFSK